MIQIQEILDLSVAERILTIEKIEDSINPDDIQLTEAHQRELEARLTRYKSGKTIFYSWDNIKAELNSIR